jgi:hypothetical protein
MTCYSHFFKEASDNEQTKSDICLFLRIHELKQIVIKLRNLLGRDTIHMYAIKHECRFSRILCEGGGCVFAYEILILSKQIA